MQYIEILKKEKFVKARMFSQGFQFLKESEGRHSSFVALY